MKGALLYLKLKLEKKVLSETSINFCKIRVDLLKRSDSSRSEPRRS